MTLFKLTIAQIKMFVRNRQGLFFTFFLPLMIMLIFGVMNFDSAATARLGVVDQAKNQGSAQLIDSLKKIEVLKITENSEVDEKTALDKGERDLVMIIPASFMQQASPFAAAIRQLEPVTIDVLYNQSQPQNVQAGTTILNEVFANLSRNITQSPDLFPINSQPISSRDIKYINFLVPGVIALSIMQMGVFAIVFSIVVYKEKGIMRRLLVTPLKSYDFTGSIVITRVLVSFLQAAVLLAIAISIFHIKIYGSYGLLALFIFLGSIVFMSLGFIISSIVKNEESAAPVANLIVLPMMFLGGVFFPVQGMPEWLQKAVVYLPINYLSDSLRKIMNEGSHFAQLNQDFYGLLIWAAILIIIAMLTFRNSKEA